MVVGILVKALLTATLVRVTPEAKIEVCFMYLLAYTFTKVIGFQRNNICQQTINFT
jgi:hypothetical protein